MSNSDGQLPNDSVSAIDALKWALDVLCRIRHSLRGHERARPSAGGVMSAMMVLLLFLRRTEERTVLGAKLSDLLREVDAGLASFGRRIFPAAIVGPAPRVFTLSAAEIAALNRGPDPDEEEHHDWPLRPANYMGLIDALRAAAQNVDTSGDPDPDEEDHYDWPLRPTDHMGLIDALRTALTIALRPQTPRRGMYDVHPTDQEVAWAVAVLDGFRIWLGRCPQFSEELANLLEQTDVDNLSFSDRIFSADILGPVQLGGEGCSVEDDARDHDGRQPAGAPPA